MTFCWRISTLVYTESRRDWEWVSVMRIFQLPLGTASRAFWNPEVVSACKSRLW